MPLYLDVHQHVAGATPEDVAKAHQRDLEIGARHGVRYLKYWHDTQAGKIFCLVEAPTADAAREVHREAHGLLADEIHPVEEHG